MSKVRNRVMELCYFKSLKLTTLTSLVEAVPEASREQIKSVGDGGTMAVLTGAFVSFYTAVKNS